MQDNRSESPQKSQALYASLDRGLLYLLSAELGYFFLLTLVGLIMSSVAIATSEPPAFLQAPTLLWPIAAYLLALPLNVLGAFISLILSIRTNHRGYPGTGHMLNWYFVLSVGWMLLFILLIIVPVIAVSD